MKGQQDTRKKRREGRLGRGRSSGAMRLPIVTALGWWTSKADGGMGTAYVSVMLLGYEHRLGH